jgi:hypothetical protein
MADPNPPAPTAMPELVLRQDQVTEQALVEALSIPGYGDFNQGTFNGGKLANKALDAKTYKESGLEAAATQFARDMGKDPEGKKIMADIKKEKGFDLNRDGKVDDREVGVAIVAVSMRGSDKKFDNHLSFEDVKQLNDPKMRAAVVAIAKQLDDSGVTPTQGSAPNLVAKSGDKGQQR